MKKLNRIVCCLLLLGIYSTVMAYNRDKAIAYAKSYWQDYNSDYNDYWYEDDQGELRHVDCANFVSQCLIAGANDKFLSQYFKNLSAGTYDDKGCIYNCTSLVNFLFQFVQLVPVPRTRAECGALQLEETTTVMNGDVIFYGTVADPYQHAVIVGPYTGDNPVPGRDYGAYCQGTKKGDRYLSFWQ